MAESERLRHWAGWEDLAAMQGLCSRRLAASPGRAYAHPGDIAWWVGWPPVDQASLAERVTLWEGGDALAGFASFSPPERELVVFVAPELIDTERAAAFEDEMTARAARASDGPVRVLEFEDEDATIERWRRRGFAPLDEGYLNLTRVLDPAAEREPESAAVEPVGDEDADARASVTYAAFDNTGPYETYLAEYRGFRASPAYPHGWDLLARDASGSPAACCIAWPDEASGAGTFEPVATHPDFHRQGFGHAVLHAGFHRLAEAGMRWAIVGTALGNAGGEALYRSVGFEPDHVLRVYERP
jgi:GNAT superfamily N-acetyltransferase